MTDDNIKTLLARLIETHLPAGSRVSFTVEGDGEGDHDYLIGNLELAVPRKDAYDTFDAFVDVWVTTPPEVRSRCRLTYTTLKQTARQPK